MGSTPTVPATPPVHQSDEPVRHPIQLKRADLVEIQFKAHKPPDKTDDVQEYVLGFARSDIMEEGRRIDILVEVEAGDQTPGKAPYYVKFAVRGVFSIGETVKLAPEKITKWAEVAAPYVLMPFIREQVYSLFHRTGFSPFNIPLFQVPTFKVEAAKPLAAE